MQLSVLQQEIQKSSDVEKKTPPTPKQGLSVSNHNYPSLLAVMYLIMLQGELKALQVSHSDGAALEHRVVRG